MASALIYQLVNRFIPDRLFEWKCRLNDTTVIKPRKRYRPALISRVLRGWFVSCAGLQIQTSQFCGWTRCQQEVSAEASTITLISLGMPKLLSVSLKALFELLVRCKNLYFYLLQGTDYKHTIFGILWQHTEIYQRANTCLPRVSVHSCLALFVLQ